MARIYFTEYVPLSDSVSDVARQEHLIGRALLFRGLGELFQLPYSPEDEKALISCDDNGKPRLTDHPDICFNITHCTGLVACVFDNAPVGIDAELPGYFPEVLTGRALSKSEKDLLMSCGDDMDLRRECFWRFWTLKEAYVKKTATGVDTDLKAFSFTFDPFSTPDIGTPVKIECSDPEVSCFQVFLKSGHIISICADPSSESFQFDVVQNIDLCHKIDE